MNLKIAQVIGLNTDQKASLSASSEREGNSFLAVLSISSDDAFTKGRGILSELEDFYFEFEGTPSEKLKACYEEAKKKLDIADTSWDLCLGAISGKVLYLIGQGQVEVFLKRTEKLSPLLSVGTPAQLISGFLEGGDRLLFATKTLSSFLGDELAGSLSLPIETFEEDMGSRIGSSSTEKDGLAGLAVEIEEEKEEIPALDEELKEEKKEEVFSESEYIEKPALKEVILPKIIQALKILPRYLPRTGRSRLILGIILIVVIAAGAGYKYKVSRDQKRDAQFNQILQEAKDDFSSAKGLASLNPGEAKGKLDLATDKVNKALALKRNSEAEDFKKQIEAESTSILKQSEVSDFPVFLDMDLVKKDFRATEMSLSAGELLLLDPEAKTLVTVNLAKKSNQILGGLENLGDAAFVSLNGSLAFVFSKDKGIIRVDLSNKKVTTVAKKDDDLGIASDIYGFAGNVYLLDSGQIWKYLPTSAGYSDKREYLTKGVQADFAGALRMQIESSIYVLKSGGEMLRFTKGDKDNFSYSGLNKGVKDPKSFFVSSDTEDLYLLDSGNSRLLILTKTGAYKSQIAGGKFASATDLVVDEKGKKVYLLEGSKIYSVDLK